MKQPRPGVRPRLIGLGLTLLLAALIGAACAPATPAAPTPGVVPTQAVTQPATAANAPTAPKAGPVAPAAPTTKPVKVANVPVGVDADGNFYRGNPNAPIKLVEFSDFQ